MFVAATHDISRMPPQCCAIIQIHTAIDALSDEAANAYRAKFEEWITRNRMYCPSPTCSAFIPERQRGEQWQAGFVNDILTEVLHVIYRDSSARFFRGDMPVENLQGYASMVKEPIDLAVMFSKLNSYTSIGEMTRDMKLIASNAKQYNGSGHPVTVAAGTVVEKYVKQLSVSFGTSIDPLDGSTFQQIFLCPKCRAKICRDCQEPEHRGRPCDHATNNAEALLEQFDYRQCPLCRHAVKKMYGCSHIQCICGAHWCYHCLRSIDKCFDGCANEIESEGELEEAAAEGEQVDGVQAALTDSKEAGEAMEGVITYGEDRAMADLSVKPPFSVRPRSRSSQSPTDHDRGGDRRWIGAEEDFGDEPEEYCIAQVWACSHSFKSVPVSNDSINCGNLSRMECNRCFRKIRLQSSGAKPPQESERDVAWECSLCRVLACEGCTSLWGRPEDEDDE